MLQGVARINVRNCLNFKIKPIPVAMPTNTRTKELDRIRNQLGSIKDLPGISSANLLERLMFLEVLGFCSTKIALCSNLLQFGLEI